MQTLTKNNLKELYEIDEHLWLEKMIQVIKENRLEYLDLEHLIEELESLGKRDLSKVRSLLRQIMIHILLLEYWTEEYDFNYRHWQTEIIAFRDDVNNNLTTSLKNKLNLSLEKIYHVALKFVSKKTGLSIQIFPNHCPYSLEKLLDDDWYPENIGN